MSGPWGVSVRPPLHTPLTLSAPLIILMTGYQKRPRLLLSKIISADGKLGIASSSYGLTSLSYG